MDSQTISSITSIAALLLSIASFLVAYHSARAGRAISTERVRREVAEFLRDLERRSEELLTKYRRLNDGGYSDLEHIQNRLTDAVAFQAKYRGLQTKFAQIESTGGARRWFDLEVLKTHVILLAKDFETIEREAQDIESVIAEFEKKESTDSRRHPA